jgi:phosphate starvation-inducible PhoH-like protein
METKPKPNGPKGEIRYNVTLNDEQKEAKALIYNNQIVVITGRAGCGKSLISAQVSLDFLFKKRVKEIMVSRSTIEVGKSMGFLPGGLDEKFDPYLEAFTENLKKCYDGNKIDEIIEKKQIKSLPIQFIRGKTIDDILIVEESQNTTKHEMLAIVTRLGKTGTIIINGDNEQQDTKDSITGLSYAIELSKRFPDRIKWIKLKHNHRSDLVGDILDYEYNNN